MSEREDENEFYEENPYDNDKGEKEGLRWRVSLSILAGVGWLVFIVLWLFFYADDYNGYQNLGVLLLSLYIVGILLGTPWTLYGCKFRTKKERDMMNVKGFKSRIIISLVAVNILMIFLIIWLFSYASDYTFFQNIAVFIAALLIFAATMGASWAPWGMKHQHEFED